MMSMLSEHKTLELRDYQIAAIDDLREGPEGRTQVPDTMRPDRLRQDRDGFPLGAGSTRQGDTARVRL